MLPSGSGETESQVSFAIILKPFACWHSINKSLCGSLSTNFEQSHEV